MTTKQNSLEESRIAEPVHKLASKYLNPIFYLADRMSSADKKVVVKERSIIEDLAESAGKLDFRLERWFRDMTLDRACEILDVKPAKRGALVILSLVLKADLKRVDEEHEFFHQIRDKLEAEPVTVPVSLDAHKALALKYLTG